MNYPNTANLDRARQEKVILIAMILTNYCDCPSNRISVRQAHTGGTVGEKITRALSQGDSILDEDCLTINV